jgi:hypothetical protein
LLFNVGPQSTHRPTANTYRVDAEPEPFALPGDIDPRGIVNIRSIANFVLRLNEAQAKAGIDKKHTMPLLSAWRGAQHERRAYGHVLVAGSLYLESRLPHWQAADPLTKAAAIAEGHEIFSALDDYRDPTDGTIRPDVYEEHPKVLRRDPNEPLRLQVGRRVADLIATTHPMAGAIASDALLALEIHTQSQTAVVQGAAQLQS